MNKARRNRLKDMAEKLESLQGDLYIIVGEEQEYYDNMPDGIKDDSKGETVQATIDLLEEAGCSFYDLVDSIRTAAEE